MMKKGTDEKGDRFIYPVKGDGFIYLLVGDSPTLMDFTSIALNCFPGCLLAR